MLLDNIDRGTIQGFSKYFRNRREHFKDIFGIEYSEESAKVAWQEVQEIILLSIETGIIDELFYI
jgi:hypothetical protein